MKSKIRPFILSEATWRDIKSTSFDVAILPWGATEAHNYHLPYGTDNYLAENIAIQAAEIAWNENALPIVLPTIHYGVNTGQMDIPLCMNMNPSTQLLVLKDIVQVLSIHNISKLVIINAHGGNHFKQMIRELSNTYPNVFVCAINWWSISNPLDIFDDPGDHAGELETSAMMYFKPELVLPLDEAGPGITKQFKLKGLKEGWVTAQRQWTKVSTDTGTGNPKKATIEKGKKFTEIARNEIAQFIIELSKTDINDLYE